MRMKQKVLSILALLLMAATGAWAQGYTVTLKDGTEDAENWTISPSSAAEGQTVTITYSGSKRVKSVTAVKKAPSGPEVTTFSELQTALSAGKNVKLMNDIVCTAEISITSNGALTIDGNGKKLSTTSEIRAFKVGSSATVAFKDFTLTGFVSGGGPAINNAGGTIVLDGCTISNCHVNNGNGGGAIENKSGGKLYAINTTFSGNYSDEIGGAINNYNSSLYMSGCTFTNNYTTKSNANYGGAIGINGGIDVRLINCAFSGNKYGTTTGPSDIGVYNKPFHYTIAGCTGATIGSDYSDITTNASGTATLDYSDLSNISFTYSVTASGTNLSTLTDDYYEAQDGETLTGTLANNVNISIADGATVTLKDVNITNLGDDCDWAGINCLGNATLVLEGTNEVCAGRDGYGDNNYPGIYIAPGKTLTIQGDGTLTAYSNGTKPSCAGIGGGFDIACGHIVINSGNITATGGQYAAGIGGGNDGDCGTITINGGNITATGGQYAAGIGTGYTDGATTSCGNITISGGTVTATGCNNAAGIGSGYNGGGGASHGNITISSGVTKVTATKGSNAPNSIGAGKDSQAITVNIEAGANVTQN